MLNRVFVPLVASFLLSLVIMGCAPSRAIIAPGHIPAAPSVSREDERYGQAVLAELTQQHPLSRDDVDINRSRDIVQRLTEAAKAQRAPWNVFVLRGDAVVNAAATRGNYVFVWTGLLRTTHSDGELAAVLAHELGHLLAGHTQATPSEEARAIIAQTSGHIASQVVATQGPYGALASITGALITEAIKAIAVNPESQRQELEADHIGFFLMAEAAYDPKEALNFWSRLAASDPGTPGLQMLSSHPANEERLQELQRLLPAAESRFVQVSTTPRSARAAPSSSSSSLTDGATPNRAEPDSFAFGQEAPRNTRPTTSSAWTIVEPTTAVSVAPFAESAILQTLPAGTPVVVRGRIGRYYEISSPVQGFVRGEKISPVP